MSADSPGTGRVMTRSAITLMLFAVAGVGLVALIHHLTADRIVQNEHDFLMRSFSALVPVGSYDNDFIDDVVEVINAEPLGTMEPVHVYRARMNDRPIALIMTPQAPDGYNGPIKLMIGIEWDGAITGVRVLSHRETPGLGDDIEIERSDWILQFDRLALLLTEPDDWQIRRDGGRFDQITGASITPRAVINAVNRTLVFFENNRDLLFYAPSGTVIDGTPEE